MRDLLVFGAVATIVALGLRNSFVAFLGWSWTAVGALNNYVYGFMLSVGLNQIFAILTLGHMLFYRVPKGEKFVLWNRTASWMTLFAIQGLIAAAFSYPGGARNWEYSTDLFKTLAFCLTMLLLVNNRDRTHAMVLVLAIGMSFHGLLDGLKFLASGGGHLAHGIPKFGDNNHFAVMLAMVIPVTYYLARYSAHRLVRFGFAAASVVCVLAVVATQSRGGLLCIGVLGFWMIKNSRHKLSVISIVAIGAMLVVALAPASWSERMGTMRDAGEDGSFMGRVMAWKRSSAMAMEHPLVGAGLGSAGNDTIYWKFANEEGFMGFVQTPPPDGIAFVAHNIFFQVMGDMGFVGFFMFTGLLFNAFMARNEIRRRIPASPAGGLAWAGDLADMLAVALIVFIVGGSLVSIAYQEFPYILMMLLEVLRHQVIRATTSPATSTTVAGVKGKS
jgi:probable O-glycosylation ligase (exosortase A-associated)